MAEFYSGLSDNKSPIHWWIIAPVFSQVETGDGDKGGNWKIWSYLPITKIDGYSVNFTVPTRAIEWVDRLPETARLVAHCTAGVSRSTALSYALLRASMSDQEAMAYVLRVRPEAKPNALMIRHTESLSDRVF